MKNYVIPTVAFQVIDAEDIVCTSRGLFLSTLMGDVGNWSLSGPSDSTLAEGRSIDDSQP